MQHIRARKHSLLENDTKEVPIDFYPNPYPDGRRFQAAGGSVDKKQKRHVVNHESGGIKYDRRVLTYDYYPNDRRKGNTSRLP